MVCIKISKENLLKLHELEIATGIGKNDIVSILIDEVFSCYKCSIMSGDPDYMPMQLTTEELKRNIKSRK